MTEEQQGGTTPPAEASAEAQAPEEADATIVVADDPAETTTAEPAADPDPEPETGQPAAEAAEPVTEAKADAEPEPVPDEPTASEPVATDDVPVATEAPEATDDAPVAVEAAEAPDDAASSPDAAPDGAAGDVEAAPEGIDASDYADAPAAEPDPIPTRKLGPEPTTMEELLAEQDGDIKSFKHGDVVEGTVVRIDKDEILVDIGAKSEGVVSNRELFGRHGESQPALAIGDTVLVYVLQPESPEGHVVLSLRRAGLERKWRSMQEQFESGVIIEAPVIDHNKGGLIVDCGIRGFVPISQIVDFPRRPQNDQPRDAAQEIAEKLQPFVG
ncbi:MAG: S1 RNA-binding domain-containing protein, partial [Candidatus Limnocylindrales bacterium]